MAPGSKLLLSLELRRRWEDLFGIFFLFVWFWGLVLVCLVFFFSLSFLFFFYKSRTKEDGIRCRSVRPSEFKTEQNWDPLVKAGLCPTEGAAEGGTKTDVPYARCLPCVQIAHYEL